MLNKIKIRKLFKKLLFLVYKKKKKTHYQLELRELIAYKELKKVKA